MGRLAFVSVAVLVVLMVACTGSSAPPAPGSASPSAVPSESPSSSRASDIRFLLGDTYPAGDRITVRIENVGDVAYRYQPIYQACFLSYFDSQGREFIIPPGTHCDILAQVVIRPGEAKRLFAWDLDECVKDNWGCAKSKTLAPGTYTIRGTFRAVGEGPPARAESTFEIQPAR